MTYFVVTCDETIESLYTHVFFSLNVTRQSKQKQSNSIQRHEGVEAYGNHCFNNNYYSLLIIKWLISRPVASAANAKSQYIIEWGLVCEGHTVLFWRVLLWGASLLPARLYFCFQYLRTLRRSSWIFKIDYVERQNVFLVGSWIIKFHIPPGKIHLNLYTGQVSL